MSASPDFSTRARVIIDQTEYRGKVTRRYVEPGNMTEYQMLEKTPSCIQLPLDPEARTRRRYGRLSTVGVVIGTIFVLAGTEIHINSAGLAIVGGVLAAAGITGWITKAVNAVRTRGRHGRVIHAGWLIERHRWEGINEDIDSSWAEAAIGRPALIPLIGTWVHAHTEMKILGDRLDEGRRLWLSTANTPVGKSLEFEVDALNAQYKTSKEFAATAQLTVQREIEAARTEQEITAAADKSVAEQNAAQAWLDEQGEP